MEEKPPSPKDVLITVPLYRPYVFGLQDVWTVARIIYWIGVYDSYCIGCGKDSTFKIVSDGLPKHLNKFSHEQRQRDAPFELELPILDDGVYVREAVCSRSVAHKQHFVFHVESEIDFENDIDSQIHFQKIGQFPSSGDINIAKVKSYAGVLEKELQREFARAIGLASHDVGVGAYVYLRRVFEALVEEVHREAAVEKAWSEEIYERSRMSERIVLLKERLPKFLTDHPEMYALLSKGIHELSELECLRNFEALKIGIELILDQRLEEKERRKKIEAASRAIRSAHQEAAK